MDLRPGSSEKESHESFVKILVPEPHNWSWEKPKQWCFSKAPQVVTVGARPEEKPSHTASTRAA